MADERSRRNSRNGSSPSSGKNREEEAPGVCISIRTDRDIILARQKGKEMAASIGFSSTDLTLIATAISELSRNIVLYAKTGEIMMRPTREGDKKGMTVVARDEGPGIHDVTRALQDGFSTSRSLGLGLPGVRRLMDAFELVSEVNQGTTVTVKKWALPK